MTTARQQPRVPAGCSAEEARALTDQIKATVEHTWTLLIAAYERRAWSALDYTSWESYVTAEFGISRSRSYQLIDQAKVVREIATAADLSTAVDIKEATARDIKPRLAEVVEDVREATAGVPDAERPAVVAEVVKDARERFVADRASGEVLSPEDWAARNPAPAPAAETSPAPLTDPVPAAEVGRQPGAGEPRGGDGWSPSDALDRRPARPKQAPATSSRPSTLDESFAEAAVDLRKAVDRMERLSADGRFASSARKIDEKHGGGIAYAMEGLNLVRIRLRAAKPAVPSPPTLISGGGGTASATDER